MRSTGAKPTPSSERRPPLDFADRSLAPWPIFESFQSKLASDAVAFTKPVALFATVLLWTVFASEASTDQHPLVLSLSAMCAAGSVIDSARRAALCVGCTLQLHRIVEAFPSTANHSYLQGLLLLITAVLAFAPEPDAQTERLASLRFVAATVLIWSGLQKVLYGAYFDGTMLTLLASKHERFRWMLSPFLDAQEIIRLRALDIHISGSGPFRSSGIPLLIASNVTWIAEIALGSLLLLRQRHAATLSIVFFILIELAAREVVFGIVMTSLVSLFCLPSRSDTILRGLCLVTWLFSLVALGVLPGAEHLLLTEMP